MIGELEAEGCSLEDPVTIKVFCSRLGTPVVIFVFGWFEYTNDFLWLGGIVADPGP